MTSRINKRSGFTLIEVLLVLVILAGLGAIAIVALTGTQQTANIDMTSAKMGKLMGALDRYKVAFQHYPSEEEGNLEALVVKPAFEDEAKGAKWVAPYAKRADLKDAWDKDIAYEIMDDESSGVVVKVVQLISAGPDGDMDTDDDIFAGGPEDEQ